MSLLVAGGMIFTNCSDDFLEVTNPNRDYLEDYYKTDEHIQEALIAAYDPIHWPDWGLGQYNALNIDAEIQGDNFWVGGETKNDMQNWHMLFNYEGNENNTLSSLWTVDYSGIKRCNDVLRYIPWGTDVTPGNAKSYEMQARAMRVFYYNMLWHYFGNIPFYLENLSAPYTAPQKKADEVYAELIRELEEVIDSKVLPMRWDNANSGRASQAMCYMMYAEMVMYQKDTARYPKALQYMQEIISSNDYALNPDYAKIWYVEGEWTKESIWEINYESLFGKSTTRTAVTSAVGAAHSPSVEPCCPPSYHPTTGRFPIVRRWLATAGASCPYALKPTTSSARATCAAMLPSSTSVISMVLRKVSPITHAIRIHSSG